MKNTNNENSLGGADPGPSVSYQGCTVGATSGPSVAGDQEAERAGPGLSEIICDQGHQPIQPFSHKNISLFGTWNVRTLLPVGKPELVAKALSDYKVSICCLQEIRLPTSGCTILHTPDGKGTYHLYHSHSDKGLYGVGIALSSHLSSSVKDFQVISDRIIKIVLSAKPFDLVIISAYSPTNVSSPSCKDNFYSQLSDTISNIHRNNFVFVGLDANAKVGNDTNSANCKGYHCFHNVSCDNGHRLINLCSDNFLVASNTLFQHKAHHKVTWHSPDGKTRSMIDYILVKQRWRSSIHDTRAYWGSIDTAKSDHALVVSKIKLHFKITRPKTKALRFKTHLLKLPNVCNQFNAVLESKLQNLDNSSVNEICSSIKDSIIKTASQVLGKKHQTFSAWISSQTLDLIQRRHLLPRHLRPERSLLDKEIKMSLKNDRENYWSSIASKMEFANAVGDSRQLYKLIRQASGKNPSHISGRWV